MNAAIDIEKLRRHERRKSFVWVKRNWGVYVMLLPALACTFVFSYMPMPGLMVAFQKSNPFAKYDIISMLTKNEWVGLFHIRKILSNTFITRSIGNTLYLSVLSLVIGFPAPLILAFLLNEIKSMGFKRTVQTVSYLPYFLSWISVIGLALNLYSMYGSINDLRIMFARWMGWEEPKRLLFMGMQSFFVPNYMILSVWKGVGWGTIIYLAAITSIDPQLYEAAVMDGAGKLRQTWHISLPGIMPTAMILLIFQLGGLFVSNFELVYGLQNAFIDFEVISTIVFKMGIGQGDYGLATAVGFMQGIIAFSLTFGANWLSKKITGLGIW